VFTRHKRPWVGLEREEEKARQMRLSNRQRLPRMIMIAARMASHHNPASVASVSYHLQSLWTYRAATKCMLKHSLTQAWLASMDHHHQ
jgi:hypothetical protein